MRHLVGSFAAVVAVAGSSAPAAAAARSGSPPPPVCTAVPDGLTLVVNSGEGVVAVTSSTHEPLVESLGAPAVAGVRGPDGTVWVERGGAEPAILRANREAPPAEVHAADEVALGTAGWLGGRSAAVFLDTTGVPEPTTQGIGGVIVDFADGTQLTVSPSEWWEAGVSSATIGADRVVEGGGELVDDWFRAFGPDGTPDPDWISPNNGDAPPAYMAPAAAVTPDGARAELSYLERGVQGADGVWSDRYALVVADAVTGTETRRLDVGEDGSWPIRADFDGRFWVATFGPMPDFDGTDPVARRVVVVDTEAEAPSAIDLGCPAGTTASIDKAGSPPPNLPAPVAPTTVTTPPTSVTPTTPAPPTTDAARCDGYVDADNAYPVQRCEQGAAVLGVQLMLIERGFDIEADGDFGPATAAAVRQFQAGAGLPVDELVGPDTWGALYDPSHLPGVDNDGNGTVDPWELILDAGGTGDYAGLVFDETDDRRVITPDGEPVDGLQVRGGWLVSDPNAGGPMYGFKEVTGGAELMLWFSRTDGNRPDGTVLPWTVLDWIAVPGAATGTIATSCELDGALDPTVVGLVEGQVGGGTYTDIPAAWQADTATGAIIELDPARVRCLIEGD